MKAPYENNPLTVSVNGLDLLFTKAKSVGIFFLVLLGIGFLLNLPSIFVDEPESTSAPMTNQEAMHTIQTVPLEFWLIVGAIVLGITVVVVFIQLVISGISDYTSAQLLKNKQVTLSEALSGLFDHFWGYTLVYILVSVKIFLWSLLFIIPGFYFSYRYSLAGVSFFDKKLTGNGAIKDSLTLTRGAWLTTFASHSILALLTFGLAQQIVMPGGRAILYRQFTDLQSNPKPPAHVLSWLTLLLPIMLCVLFGLLIFGLIVLLIASV